MTLDQLLQGYTNAEELRTMWLVFDSVIAQRLKDVQPAYQHQAFPITLKDGNFALCADLLTEKDDIYAPTFQALDQTLFPQVQVLSQAAIIELFLPPDLDADVGP
jgi:hypothetical protein